MTTISTSFATRAIDMTDASIVTKSGSGSADASLWSWHGSGSPPSEVVILGHGFGIQNGRPTSGTIDSIGIDLSGGTGAGTELVITETGSLNVAMIQSGNARAFWDEVLKGNDSFDLRGLAGTTGTSLVFGDDRSAKGAIAASGFTDRGGHDSFLGGDSELLVMGDAETAGGATVGGQAATVIYDAGDDTITSGVSDERMEAAGDVRNVKVRATVYAGDDVIDLSANTSGQAFATGDVGQQSGGTLWAGDDVITGGRRLGAVAAGDAAGFQGGTLYGGDDSLTSSGPTSLAGDVREVGAGAQGRIVGGDDTLTGSGSGERLTGDVTVSHAKIEILCGDDTLYGNGGDDRLFGDVAETDVSTEYLTGGADSLYGGSGSDRLWGGKGQDRLEAGSGADQIYGGKGYDRLRGGTGDDQLTGGSDSADLFVFGTGSGRDRILDFTDEGQRWDDKIDLSATSLDDMGDLSITKSSNGDDALIGLGDGDRIRLVGYLDDHKLSDLGASDFAF